MHPILRYLSASAAVVVLVIAVILSDVEIRALEDDIILDLAALTEPSTDTLIGRKVVLSNVPVAAPTSHGFWAALETGNRSVFVRPAEGTLITVWTGELVNLQGEVRALSPDLLAAWDLDTDDDWFVYAYTVRHSTPVTADPATSSGAAIVR